MTQHLNCKFVLFLFCIATLFITLAPAQSQAPPPGTPIDALRKYIDLRLHWASWEEYSKFITWPDEPGWDCYWVAKEFSVGKAIKSDGGIVIPVTFQRLGMYCHDFDFESGLKKELVRYKMVRKDGAWKVNGPQPDYPYVGYETLRQALTKMVTARNETPERKEQAQSALEALLKAAFSSTTI